MRKAVLSFLLSLVLLLSASGVGFAQEDDATNPYGYQITRDEFAEYNAAVENCDTPSLECLVRYTTRFIAMEWVNDISGARMEKTNLIDGNEQTDSSLQQPQSGLVAGVFRMIGSMYSYRPANTNRYVADVINSAGFATPAYAQGLGFASLDPILNLWKMFRNVAYFFFIIVFILIGFMIMFRTKISGQAVITAQQAIPSVIISLILVTFSYAIAGFMIDLMYLLMFLIVGLFTNISGLGQGDMPIPADGLISLDIIRLTGMLFWNSAGQLEQNAAITDQFLDAAGVPGIVNNPIGEFIGGLTLTIVITIATLIACVKLFFELLKSYATIILSVVFAPLALMVGAFPGKDVFGPWLKGIIGNLLAFPTVLLLVIMFLEFTKRGTTLSSSGGFMPPFLIGSGQAGIIAPLMGFAVIMAMPEIVKKVKDATGASDGGLGAVIAGAAWGTAKEAWGGSKYSLGIGGKRVLGAGAALTGAAIGVPAGAIIGGEFARRKGLDVSEYRKRGMLIGGGIPLAGGLLNPIRRGVGMVNEVSKAAENVVNLRKAQQDAFAQAKLRKQDEDAKARLRASDGDVATPGLRAGETRVSSPTDPSATRGD